MAPPVLDDPETFEVIGSADSDQVGVLVSRRDALVDGVVGEVLQLSGRGRSADDVQAALANTGATSFDAIVSVLCLSTAPDPAAVLELLVDHVAPGGRLLVLEATRRPSRSLTDRLVDGVGTKRTSNTPALRTDLDIPTLVRSAGFGPIRVERFGLGSVASDAVFVSLEARRRSELRPLDHAAGQFS